MSARLAVLNEELERGWGVTAREPHRASTPGPVIASGDATSRQRLVTGDTVNVAARLEQAAPPYEVLIGEPTYRLVRDAVEVEAVEPLELKGKSERVPAYRLLAVAEIGEAAAAARPAARRPRARARACSTEALEAAIAERAPAGSSTILAEAGTGKSRLIEELMALARARAAVAPSAAAAFPTAAASPSGRSSRSSRRRPGSPRTTRPRRPARRSRALVGDDAVADRVAVGGRALRGALPARRALLGRAQALRGTRAAAARSSPSFEDVHWAETRAARPALPRRLDRDGRADPARLLRAARARGATPGLARGRRGDASSGSARSRPRTSTAGRAPARRRAARRGARPDRRRPPRATRSSSSSSSRCSSRRGCCAPRASAGWPAPDFAERVAVPASIEALLAARLDLLPRDELTVVESASVIGLVFPTRAARRARPADARRRLDEQLARRRGAQPRARRDADGARDASASTTS